jgi:hypothetical protein
MKIPSVCDGDPSCMSRIRATDCFEEDDPGVDLDEWVVKLEDPSEVEFVEGDVYLKDLQSSAKGGCPLCKLHLSTVAASSTATSDDIVISHRWIGKDGSAPGSRDLSKFMVDGQWFTVFTYAGKVLHWACFGVT